MGLRVPIARGGLFPEVDGTAELDPEAVMVGAGVGPLSDPLRPQPASCLFPRAFSPPLSAGDRAARVRVDGAGGGVLDAVCLGDCEAQVFVHVPCLFEVGPHGSAPASLAFFDDSTSCALLQT